jgi:hypothetical protein
VTGHLTVAVLLTITMLVGIAIRSVRWRLPNQPRLAPLTPRERRPRSARAELAVEVLIVAAACTALPLAVIGLLFLCGHLLLR